MSELLRRATQPALHRGLDGVVVDESELSRVDGDAGQLIYRGYEIGDLARHASFEEVLYLLWQGSLPTRDELEAFGAEMAAERGIDDAVVELLDSLADADEEPMAALRTGVSMLSAYDPDDDADPEDLDATFRKGRRIAAAIPTIIAAYDRLRSGEDPVEPREDLSYAANFLYMLSGEEPPVETSPRAAAVGHVGWAPPWSITQASTTSLPRTATDRSAVPVTDRRERLFGVATVRLTHGSR